MSGMSASSTGDPNELPNNDADSERPLKPWHCGANNRQGKPCRGMAMANGRCKNHGGKSLRGPASPSFKTGRYSRSIVNHLPKRLRERFEQAMSDPNLLSLRGCVALTDIRLQEALDQFAACDASNYRTRLLKLWEQFEANKEGEGDADSASKADKILDKIGRTIKDGVDQAIAYEAVSEAIKDRVTVTREEQKLLVDMGQMISIEQAMSLVIVLHQVIAKHVVDRQVLSAIGIELEHTLGLYERPLSKTVEAEARLDVAATAPPD